MRRPVTMDVAKAVRRHRWAGRGCGGRRVLKLCSLDTAASPGEPSERARCAKARAPTTRKRSQRRLPLALAEARLAASSRRHRRADKDVYGNKHAVRSSREGQEREVVRGRGREDEGLLKRPARQLPQRRRHQPM